VFNFAGEDPSLPLFAFIFLVALGVDYSPRYRAPRPFSPRGGPARAGGGRSGIACQPVRWTRFTCLRVDDARSRWEPRLICTARW
jgi:hypothetical protein